MIQRMIPVVKHRLVHIFLLTLTGEKYLILYGHRSEVFDIAWRSGPTAADSPPAHQLISRVLQYII